MKRTNRLFSKRLFAYALRESWLPFLLLTAYAILAAFSTASAYRLVTGYDIQILTIDTFAAAGIGLTPAVTILITAKALAYYTKRCDADFFESLPYTRAQVFFSYALASSLLAFISIAIAAVGTLIVTRDIIASNVFLVWDSVIYLLDVLVSTELAIAITLLSLSLSGHIVNVIVAAFIIVSMPEILWGAFVSMAESSPLLTGIVDDLNIFATPTPLSILIVAAVTVLVGALALFLFKRRKSEIATKVYANGIVGHILRVSIALPVALTIAYCVYINDIVLTGVYVTTIIFVTILVYFGYELIAVRDKSAFLSALKGLPFLVLATALVLGAGSLTGATMSSVLPTEDSIRYVSVGASSYDYYGYVYDLPAHVTKSASDIRLDEDEAKKIIADALYENEAAHRNGEYHEKYYDGKENYMEITVEIGLPVGSVKRNLMVDYEDYMILCDLLAEREEYRDLFTDLPKDPVAIIHYNDWGTAQISRSDAEDVYEALLRDVSKMTFKQWYEVANSYDSEYALGVVVKSGSDAYILSLPVCSDTPEAYALMKDKVADRIKELHTDLSEKIELAMQGGDEIEMALDLYYGEDEYFSWFTVDSSEEGRAVGEFILEILAPVEPEYNGNCVSIGSYDSDYSVNYVKFAFTEKYSIEEIKAFFDEYSQ